MKIRALGCGGAWAPAGIWHTAHFVTYMNDTDGTLVDCGSDIRHMLSQCGILPEYVRSIWITHLHGDHVDGLEYFAFYTKCKGLPKPTLYAAAQHIAEIDETLRPKIRPFENGRTHTLDDYFNVVVMDIGDTVPCGSLQLSGVPFAHINALGLGEPDLYGNTFGCRIENGKHTVLFTGDCRAPSEEDLLIRGYEDADLIFHDCSMGPSAVHASFDELKRLPEHIKAKMVLTHCTPDIRDEAKVHGFLQQARTNDMFIFGECNEPVRCC